ncbi:MAG: lipopolysaccharide biosynthesis protein [Planctomycetota bacterium]
MSPWVRFRGAAARFGELPGLLRETPDLSTDAGRSRDRYRKAAFSSAASLLSWGLQIVLSLVTIPLTIRYLGESRYGLWITITAAIGFLPFADLGIGTGLQNKLAECHGKDDRTRPRQLVTTALATLTGFCLLLIAMAFFLAPHLPLDQWIKIENDPVAQQELLPTFQAVMLALALGFPMGAVRRMCNSQQIGYLAHFWMASGRFLSLVLLLVVIYFNASLPVLVLAMMAPPLLMMGLGAGVTLWRTRPWLRPAWNGFRLGALAAVLHVGTRALVVEVGWLIVLTAAPPLLLANRFDVSEATPYGTTHRLIAISGLILATVTQSLWPAYTEAIARGDAAWARRTLGRTLKLSLVVQCAVFLAVLLLGKPVIRLWATEVAEPTWGMLLAINGFFLVAAVDACFYTMLMAMSRFRAMILGLVLFGGPAVGLAFVFADTLGPAGIAAVVLLGGQGGRFLLSALDVRRALRDPALFPAGSLPSSQAPR